MNSPPIKPGTARRLGLDRPAVPKHVETRISLDLAPFATELARMFQESAARIRDRGRIAREMAQAAARFPIGAEVERLPIGDDLRWLYGTVDMIDWHRPHGDTHRVALAGSTATCWLNPKNLRRPPLPGSRALDPGETRFVVDETPDADE